MVYPIDSLTPVSPSSPALERPANLRSPRSPLPPKLKRKRKRPAGHRLLSDPCFSSQCNYDNFFVHVINSSSSQHRCGWRTHSTTWHRPWTADDPSSSRQCDFTVPSHVELKNLSHFTASASGCQQKCSLASYQDLCPRRRRGRGSRRGRGRCI
jgi:hypothetical protein